VKRKSGGEEKKKAQPALFQKKKKKKEATWPSSTRRGMKKEGNAPASHTRGAADFDGGERPRGSGRSAIGTTREKGEEKKNVEWQLMKRGERKKKNKEQTNVLTTDEKGSAC